MPQALELMKHADLLTFSMCKRSHIELVLGQGWRKKRWPNDLLSERQNDNIIQENDHCRLQFWC